MAGAILDRELTAPQRGRVRFALARSSDDAAIRRLLRANPMRGDISLTFEREPEYFLGDNLTGSDDRTIVAFENERLVCMGRCSVRSRFLNGQVRRVGYLGELRLDASVAGRFDILRRGYRFFRELYADDPPDAWLTSVAADNDRSRRFLERNLRGMPRYDFLGEFVTALIAVPRRARAIDRLQANSRLRLNVQGLRVEAGSPALVPAMVRLLNACGARTHFTTEWSVDRLRSLERVGLKDSDWLAVREADDLVACAALWDQRNFRQTVLRGYSRRLGLARPLINALAAMGGTAGLPPVNTPLAHGFLSPLAVVPGREHLLPNVIALALARARARGLDFLTLGCPSEDPTMKPLRETFRCRDYRSRLYQVSWPETGSVIALDKRSLAPEVALL